MIKSSSFSSLIEISASSEVDNELLTRLFSVSGTLALKAFAYVDCKVQADLDSKKSLVTDSNH